MKFSKKKVFVAALAVCLIAILSMGSLAWFNAKDEVTNTFNVADSTGPSVSPNFSIKVEETSNDSSVADKVDNNTYNDVLPGQKIAKDPTITNTSTESSQFVRVNIVISKAFADQIAEVQNTTAANLDLTKLLVGFNTAKYEDARVFDNTTYADYYIYAYYLKGKLAVGDANKHVVFTDVQIPGNFVQEDMNYGEFKINVKAEAVQTKFLGNGVDTASEAFAAVGWEVGTDYDYPASEPTSSIQP